MGLLITPSLFDSIDWLNKCPASYKKGAYKQLSNSLNRVWTPPNKAIKRGMDYEKKLCHGVSPIDDVAPDLHEKFKKAYDRIHAEGCNFQHKAKKNIFMDEKEFTLYGKLDVYFEDKPIIDIKTTGNYRGKGSYLSKWQHKVYPFCTGIADFTYIVYEFDNDSGLLINIHFIDYHVDDFVALEKEIMDNLAKVIKFIRSDVKLKKAYLNTFNMYNN